MAQNEAELNRYNNNKIEETAAEFAAYTIGVRGTFLIAFTCHMVKSELYLIPSNIIAIIIARHNKIVSNFFLSFCCCCYWFYLDVTTCYVMSVYVSR